MLRFGVLFGVLLAAAAPSVRAILCTPDPTPAATLLIPAFTVDVSPEACGTGTGLTTLFSVNNAVARPQIAHVTLWTDQAIPVIGFDIYLTGFDVQTINLRDIFCHGVLPQTGIAVSPLGPLSEAGEPPPSCNNSTTPGGAPNYQVPFSPVVVQLLQAWFTGRPTDLIPGDCAGSGQAGDSIAVGYATIDAMTDCTLSFPSEATYYTSGVLGFDNVLWGDYAIQDPARDFAQGFQSVHLEAAPADFFAVGDRTFYGRYNGASASDRREPLPTTYSTRFALGGAFDSTTMHIWREADGDAKPYACGQRGPSWHPLGFTNPFVTLWNEAEGVCTAVHRKDFGLEPPLPPYIEVPNAVNVCPFDGFGACRVPTCGFDFGWILLNLQSDASVYDDGISQAYVSTVTQASGRYSVGIGGVVIDSGCAPGTVPVSGPLE